MDQTTNELRQDIDATRDAMTDKLAQIEDRVKGTVDDFKGSVTDTVDQVKQAFDLQQQVNDRPWTMLGASVLAGYVLGSMGGDSGSSSQGYEASKYRYTPQTSYSSQGATSSAGSDSDKKWDQQTATAYAGSYNKAQSSQPGFMSDVMDQFRDELDTLKGAAVVTVTNLLRDMLKKNLPQFADEFERARSERDQKLQADPSANRSYEYTTTDVGSDRDATYQTHATPPIYDTTSTTSSSYTSGTTDSDLTRNSL